jgi:hypothetical protein
MIKNSPNLVTLIEAEPVWHFVLCFDRGKKCMYVNKTFEKKFRCSASKFKTENRQVYMYNKN